MFFFKACHSVGTETFFFTGVGGESIFAEELPCNCAEAKIGSNNDFKHCSVCCQLRSSAFELDVTSIVLTLQL